MWETWIIIAGIFFIAEAFTTGFQVFWFGLGALIVSFLSFIIPDIIVQTVIFLIISVSLLISTRPLVNKFLKTKSVRTNVFSSIGKHGIVISELDSINGTGQIKVNGEIWSAEELNGKKVPINTEVIIDKIVGVKAIVSVVHSSNNH